MSTVPNSQFDNCARPDPADTSPLPQKPQAEAPVDNCKVGSEVLRALAILNLYICSVGDERAR